MSALAPDVTVSVPIPSFPIVPPITILPPKIPTNEDVQLVVYPERRNFFDALSEQFGGGTGSAGLWSMLAGTSERRAAAALSAPTRLFRRGEPLALMPFTFVR